MKFRDMAIIIDQQKFSENGLIITLFSQNYGLLSAIINNGRKAKISHNCQIANLVEFEYYNKNSDGLGKIIMIESIISYSNILFFSQHLFNLILSSFNIIKNSFQEREVMSDFFNYFIDFIEFLFQKPDKKTAIAKYIKLELKILQYLGFGLDLSRCAVSNNNDLAFISPKTGKAVSKEVGEPFMNKLFLLPKFLHCDNSEPQGDEIRYSLTISHHFFSKFIFNHNNINISRLRRFNIDDY